MTSKAYENATDANRQQGGRRNLIINGAMQVAQRGTSTSIAHDGTENAFTLDRFEFESDFFDQFDGTVTQNSDAPSGFSSSLKWTTGTGETGVASNEYARVVYRIEAQDLQMIDSGTSNAKTMTFSFYVKSSETGTYSLSIEKNDTTARIFNSAYTINTADTWELKTITVPGDTDSGATIANDNGAGWIIRWALASGSTLDTGSVSESWSDYADDKLHALPSGDGPSNDVVTTASATWQITGVQLEVGNVATPFEHRSFQEELSNCQRYYVRLGQTQYSTGGEYSVYVCAQWSSTAIFFTVPSPVPIRAEPTLGGPSGTVGSARGAGSLDTGITVADFDVVGFTEFNIPIRITTSFTPVNAQTYSMYVTDDKYVELDAEL